MLCCCSSAVPAPGKVSVGWVCSAGAAQTPKHRRRLSGILSVAALCSLKKSCCLRLFMLESAPLVIWKASPVVVSLLWRLYSRLCTAAPGNRASRLFIALGPCCFFGHLFRLQLLAGLVPLFQWILLFQILRMLGLSSSVRSNNIGLWKKKVIFLLFSLKVAPICWVALA